MKSLRQLLLESGDINYDISPEAKKCPCVGEEEPGVEVPDTERWTDYIKYPVPLVHQASDFSCGPACLMALFLYWLPNDYPYETETELWDETKTTEKNGTDPEHLVKAAQNAGLDAEYLTEMTVEMVRELFEDGETLIMCFQAWPGRKLKKGWEKTWADGHYAVLVGMDDKNMFLMDPSTHSSYVWLPISEFEDRWHDIDIDKEHKYGMAIVVKGEQHTTKFPVSLKRLC